MLYFVLLKTYRRMLVDAPQQDIQPPETLHEPPNLDDVAKYEKGKARGRAGRGGRE